MKIYHPDKNPKGEAMFVLIKDITKILSNKDKRAIYDLYGKINV